MNKIKNSITALIILITVVTLTQSCKKSSDKVDFNSDKSKLTAEIDSLTAVYTTAVEGKQAGDYTPGSKVVLNTALTLATSVKNGQFTQQQVNNASANLLR